MTPVPLSRLGMRFWLTYIRLQADGNLLDASSFAAYTALRTARIPKVRHESLEEHRGTPKQHPYFFLFVTPKYWHSYFFLLYPHQHLATSYVADRSRCDAVSLCCRKRFSWKAGRYLCDAALLNFHVQQSKVSGFPMFMLWLTTKSSVAPPFRPARVAVAHEFVDASKPKILQRVLRLLSRFLSFFEHHHLYCSPPKIGSNR